MGSRPPRDREWRGHYSEGGASPSPTSLRRATTVSEAISQGGAPEIPLLKTKNAS